MSTGGSPVAKPHLRPRTPILFVVWLASVIGVGFAAYVDASNGESVVLNTFEADQAPVAAALAMGVATRLRLLEASAAAESPFVETPFRREQDMERPIGERITARLDGVALSAARDDVVRALAVEVAPVERDVTRVFLVAPASPSLLATDGTSLRSPALEAAVADGSSTKRLEQLEAQALGLHPRIAAAGIGRVHDPSGDWAVVIVTTAESLRDHEARTRRRGLLASLLAGAFTVVLGGLVIRDKRREAEHRREIVLQELRRDAAERLARADKLATLGALSTGIAHELSTPLNVIAGRTQQALTRCAGDEKSGAALSIVLREVDRSLAIIRGFLGLARGDSPALESLDPRLLIRSCVELTAHRFEQARVIRSVETDPDLPEIAGDRRLFEQALINLLLNACDASQPGGEVRLSVRRVAGRVSFVVDDEGPTITLAAAARATEPFFTTKEPGKGTGLGLAIANEIVKHHQGTLTIGPRPNEDRGTRACITVPGYRGEGDV